MLSPIKKTPKSIPQYISAASPSVTAHHVAAWPHAGALRRGG
jgi:hypothetical protein